MKNSKTGRSVVSLLMSMILVLGMFTGLLTSVSAQEEIQGVTVYSAPVGYSESTPGKLPAPGNPRWDGDAGTAKWDLVENAGIFNEDFETLMFYRWDLYKKNDSIPPEYNHSIRYNSTFEDPTTNSANLSEWMTEDGDYYFTVYAMGDGVTYFDSPVSTSDVFTYKKAEAKLPTPTNLKWEFYKADGKYYGVWDNIFGNEYKDAEGFLVTCYDENSEVYTHLFEMEELLADHAKGDPGTMLYMDEPDGKYQFKVRAVSANINEYQSSDWSERSPWVEVYKAPRPTTAPSGSDSGSSGGSSGGGGGTGTLTSTARASSVQTSSSIGSLAAAAKAKGETVARSRGTGEVTVKGSAWAKLGGLAFQHDTVLKGVVQSRVTIKNPAALTQDTKVSSHITGWNVKRVGTFFEKYFSNTIGVLHFDQSGEWGQDVQVAAKFDLTGMDKDNLVFYSYDKATNLYRQLPNANYSIDSNGYTLFATPFAGDIVVSDGALAKK